MPLAKRHINPFEINFAVIETAETQFFPGRRAYLSGVRPLVDGTATIQIGTRDLQEDTVSYGSAITPHSQTGLANTRSDSRYHRIRLNTTGDFTHAIGVDVEARQSGKR